MALQLRRGLDADRAATTFAEGEPIWTTDTNVLYVGDGVTPGGIEIAGGGAGVTEIVAGTNITISTSTGVVTINSTGGASTSTFYNLTVTNRISFNTATTYIQPFTDGTIYTLDIKSTNGIQLDPGGNHKVSITGNGGIEVDRISNNDAGFITVADPTTFSQTATIQSLNISLNTGSIFRSFGYGSMPYNANNMRIELPNNGSSLFFAMKAPAGQERNFGISRQGNVVLTNGIIGNVFPTGITLNANDGGVAQLQTTTSTGDITVTTMVVADNSTGISLFVDTYDDGTDTDVAFEAKLDHTGVFTVPTLSATTATAASLSVTTTATVNEVVVGPDLRVIKSQGYNVIGVDGNWRVGNVLEVGSGSASGYISSEGSHNLILQTSGNNGPGGSVVIENGAGGVSLYSGNSQEFNTANFNTTTNTINYGVTVNGPATFTSPTTLAVFTATGLTAISGAVGQIAIVSNSSPGGMMAFWDTTNSRWSYVHDNSAV